MDILLKLVFHYQKPSNVYSFDYSSEHRRLVDRMNLNKGYIILELIFTQIFKLHQDQKQMIQSENNKTSFQSTYHLHFQVPRGT